MLNNQIPVRLDDQYTDKSGATLVKIASRMKDKGLAKLALDTLFKMERSGGNHDLFPSDTPKDAFLSRVYFEGQREKIASEKASEIDNRLSIREELYNLPGKVVFRKEAAPSEPETAELLPNVKIASKEELIKAGSDFSAQFEKLSAKDRKTFANNFVKIANALSCEIPDEVCLYTNMDTAINPDLVENVHLRKIAMERRQNNAAGYDVLYESLRNSDINTFSNADLQKLASAIELADEANNLRETGHGRTIPDAWHSVFIVKKAEASKQSEAEVENMTKADIISRFGSGILEEIEDANGDIDRTRLSEIIKEFGGIDSKTTPSEEDANG